MVQLASGILFFVPAWLTKLRSPPNVDPPNSSYDSYRSPLYTAAVTVQVSSHGCWFSFLHARDQGHGTGRGHARLVGIYGQNSPLVGQRQFGADHGVSSMPHQTGHRLRHGRLVRICKCSGFSFYVAFSIAKLLAKSLMTKRNEKRSTTSPLRTTTPSSRSVPRWCCYCLRLWARARGAGGDQGD